MKANSLARATCRPCDQGSVPLTAEASRELAGSLEGWAVSGSRLEKEYRFKNFAAALAFVNQVGAIAERENHHPDIGLHSYRFVKLSLWTHVADGLTENDFILAAKIDAGRA